VYVELFVKKVDLVVCRNFHLIYSSFITKFFAGAVVHSVENCNKVFNKDLITPATHC